MEIKNALNKLDSSYAGKLGTDRADARQPAPAGGQAESGGAGDVVDIKSAGLKTAALESARNAPEIRAEKVAEIKTALAEGSYQPDSRKTAAGMLRAGRELFG